MRLAMSRLMIVSEHWPNSAPRRRVVMRGAEPRRALACHPMPRPGPCTPGLSALALLPGGGGGGAHWLRLFACRHGEDWRTSAAGCGTSLHESVLSTTERDHESERALRWRGEARPRTGCVQLDPTTQPGSPSAHGRHSCRLTTVSDHGGIRRLLAVARMRTLGSLHGSKRIGLLLRADRRRRHRMRPRDLRDARCRAVRLVAWSPEAHGGR